MNKEETKAAIAVMQAFVDGKMIEVRSNNGGLWHAIMSVPNKTLLWDWARFNYRVKPEPREIWVNEYQPNLSETFLASWPTKRIAEDMAIPSAVVRTAVLYREVIE